MYNHYTPQSDGSYQRSSRPDPGRPSGVPHRSPPAQQAAPAAPEPQSSRFPSNQPGSPDGIGSFFRGLLPRQPDAADFLVILLVLLMNREDGSSPLLTLALYFLL